MQVRIACKFINYIKSASKSSWFACSLHERNFQAVGTSTNALPFTFITKRHQTNDATTDLQSPPPCNGVPVTLGNASRINKFRCDKELPAQHTAEDEGLMYTVPAHHCRLLINSNFNNKFVSLKLQKLFDIFNETCFMVRKPGLELVNYLKCTDVKNPVNRYLLYGKVGCGKTVTLQYAVHHCLSEGWLIVPNYYMWDWLKFWHPYKEHRKNELMASQHNKDRIDQPELSARWLETFRSMNRQHLDKIFTTKEYIWSRHESTEKGVTLGALIDHGVARPRNSTDVIGCIMREIRIQDDTTMPPVLVAVDAINALFGNTTLKFEQSRVEVHQLSFIHNLRKLISNSWSNGAVVGALNTTGIPFLSKTMPEIKKHYPYDILGRKGFDWLDPHVPIHVPPYNETEVLNQLAYFKDRKWIDNRALTAEGEAEIIQLSCHNPQTLMQMCNWTY